MIPPSESHPPHEHSIQSIMKSATDLSKSDSRLSFLQPPLWLFYSNYYRLSRLACKQIQKFKWLIRDLLGWLACLGRRLYCERIGSLVALDTCDFIVLSQLGSLSALRFAHAGIDSTDYGDSVLWILVIQRAVKFHIPMVIQHSHRWLQIHKFHWVHSADLLISDLLL